MDVSNLLDHTQELHAMGSLKQPYILYPSLTKVMQIDRMH